MCPSRPIAQRDRLWQGKGALSLFTQELYLMKSYCDTAGKVVPQDLCLAVERNPDGAEKPLHQREPDFELCAHGRRSPVPKAEVESPRADVSEAGGALELEPAAVAVCFEAQASRKRIATEGPPLLQRSFSDRKEISGSSTHRVPGLASPAARDKWSLWPCGLSAV